MTLPPLNHCGMAVSYKVKTYLPYNPAILKYYPQEMKTVFIPKLAHKCLYWLYSLMPEAENRTVFQEQSTVIHTYNGILHSEIKRTELLTMQHL